MNTIKLFEEYTALYSIKLDNIQEVYAKFHESPNSVVYSEDGGITWKTPPMDTGKWHANWEYAFLKTVFDEQY